MVHGFIFQNLNLNNLSYNLNLQVRILRLYKELGPSRVAFATPSPLNDNPFTTEVGTTVIVNQNRHQRSTGDAVRFYQVKNPVGGVAISTFELSTTLNGTITADATSLVLN